MNLFKKVFWRVVRFENKVFYATRRKLRKFITRDIYPHRFKFQYRSDQQLDNFIFKINTAGKITELPIKQGRHVEWIVGYYPIDIIVDGTSKSDSDTFFIGDFSLVDID